MDVISHNAFWTLKNGLPPTYPTLTEDLRCEVAVIGAGISGALVADALVARGLDVVLLEKCDVASGSTSGSTALLQYEIDTHLVELTRLYDRTRAERAYWACHEAIDKIEGLCGELGIAPSFRRCPSVYFASKKSDVETLRREHAAREAAGFAVDFLNEEIIKKRFSFARPAALYSHQGAEVDPYLLTVRLIERAVSRGLRAYDRSPMKKFKVRSDHVTVTTERGIKVRARHLVIANGYEAQKYLPRKLVELNSSFAMVTKPVANFEGWPERCLLWETARPYFYLRTTPDHRILIGGEDKPFRNPVARDALIPSQTKKLWKRFQKMFPRIEAEYAYSWAGTFGESRDGLGYIGEHEKYPGVNFVCGFGGNGITYSVIAASVIAEALEGREHPDAHIFRFDREPHFT